MLSFPGHQRVYVSTSAIDFRRSHDGLCAIVRDQLRDDPFTGDLFLSWNRGKDRIKLLVWDRVGFWLLYKRKEKGAFPLTMRSDAARIEIDHAQLAMLLEGIEWQNARRSSRYMRSLAIKSHDGSHPHVHG